MSIKDVQKWVMFRPKLDVSGYGDQNFRLFFADVMNEGLLIKFFFATEYYFFFVCLYVFSLSSFAVIFIVLHIKQKR